MKKSILTAFLISTAFSLCQLSTAQPPDTPPGKNQMKRPHDAGRRPYADMWFKKLKQEQPEEFQRLSTLKQEDPEAFRKELRKRVASLRASGKYNMHSGRRSGPLEPRSEALGNMYKEQKALLKQLKKSSEEERDSITEALHANLGNIFDERESLRIQDLERMEKELARHKEMSEKRMEKRDAIINTELQQILSLPIPQPADIQ